MTADTSAVVAALSRWHEAHDVTAAALAKVRALPSHVIVETYSVLTRLPGGLAVPAATAAAVLARRFPDQPLRLEDDDQATLLRSLAEAGVFAGSSYDGLVGLQAAAHDRMLVTLDRRATATYRALGVRYRLVTG